MLCLAKFSISCPLSLDLMPQLFHLRFDRESLAADAFWLYTGHELSCHRSRLACYSKLPGLDGQLAPCPQPAAKGSVTFSLHQVPKTVPSLPHYMCLTKHT